MDEMAAERKTLIRASFFGSLIFTAGLSTQFYLCIFSVFRFTKHARREKERYKFYLGTMIIVLVLTTAAFGVHCAAEVGNYTDFEWISGSSSSPLPRTPAWVVVASGGLVSLIHLVGDALLAWRCYIIWSHNRKVGLIPLVPYLALIGVGATFLAMVAKTDNKTSGPSEAQLYLKLQAISFLLSVGVNITATALICLRFALMISTLRRAHGPDLPSSTASYSRISTILVESALPFTVFSLACALVSFLQVRNPEHLGALSAYRIVYPMWTIMCGLAPQLIISRVIKGNSWVSNPGVQGNGSTQSVVRFAIHEERANNISMDTRSIGKGALWKEDSTIPKPT